MDALTIHEAAETTGWSPRMLRYVERVGLVEPARSAAGYRLYGPAELQRLRTLRELLTEHEIGLSDVAFARRLREETGLRRDTEAWLEAEAIVRYTELWATEPDMRRRVRSEQFTSLLGVVESAREAAVQFDFVTSTRGLDYIEEVRGQPRGI